MRFDYFYLLPLQLLTVKLTSSFFLKPELVLNAPAIDLMGSSFTGVGGDGIQVGVGVEGWISARTLTQTGLPKHHMQLGVAHVYECCIV